MHATGRHRGTGAPPHYHRGPAATPDRSAPMNLPKYALAEIERRWLVPEAYLAVLAGQPCRLIEDTYIEGTLLRLRAVHGPDGDTVYKLCKKYGRRDTLANPMTNIYLSEHEYRLLRALGGAQARKHRYAVEGGSVDVYLSPVSLALFDIEFDDEQRAREYVPPSFVGKEVTDDVAYSGAALAARRI